MKCAVGSYKGMVVLLRHGHHRKLSKLRASFAGTMVARKLYTNRTVGSQGRTASCRLYLSVVVTSIATDLRRREKPACWSLGGFDSMEGTSFTGQETRYRNDPRG
jgi:hypothetical protein